MTADLQPLLNSVKDAVNTENWLAGLALSLALPDICGRIQFPRTHSGGLRGRYVKWWQKTFGRSYKYGTARRDCVTGIEVYLLRCAYLHQGTDESDPKFVRKYQATINRFNFNISNGHLKKDGTRVLLNVRTFCLDMCDHIEKWDNKVLSKHPKMQARASDLLKIYAFFPLQARVQSGTAVNVRLIKTK